MVHWAENQGFSGYWWTSVHIQNLKENTAYSSPRCYISCLNRVVHGMPIIEERNINVNYRNRVLVPYTLTFHKLERKSGFGKHLYMLSVMSCYLEIRHHFAQSLSKEPGLGNVHDQTSRQADDGDQDVSKGQIHYEIICHCAHVTVLPHCKTNWT